MGDSSISNPEGSCSNPSNSGSSSQDNSDQASYSSSEDPKEFCNGISD